MFGSSLIQMGWYDNLKQGMRINDYYIYNKIYYTSLIIADLSIANFPTLKISDK
jgi:hypothetical protein